VKTLPKVFISLFIGIVLTYLVFLFGSIHQSGPSSICLLLVMPFQILSSLITNGRVAGEFVYYGLQVAFYGGAVYLLINFFVRPKK
jgi:uncharacterized protein (DUF983 family)